MDEATAGGGSVAARSIELPPDEVELVRTALRLLESTLGREEADELEAVQRLLRRLAPSDSGR
jgi:hypothetical protein